MKLRTTLCLLLTAYCLLLLHATAWAVDLSDYPPDDPKDWGPSFQAAVDDLKDTSGGWKNTSGGEIVLGEGVYPVTTGVLLDCPGVLIRGVGNPFSHSCVIEWWNRDPEAALFTFVSPRSRRFERSNGFAMRDVRLMDMGNVKAGKSARVDTTAFRLGKNDRYSRDFSFQRVTANYFGAVFRTQKGGQASVWGGVSANKCTFTFNGQVVDATSGGAWNEWRFDTSLLHKNGLKAEGWPARYAFDFARGSQGTFDGCLLEAQPRALRVRHFHGLRVIGCRFEANATSEDPVCLIEDSTGVWFRENFHRVMPAEESPDASATINLRRCLDYQIDQTMGRVVIERDWEPR